MKMERIVHALLFTPLRGGRWGLPGLFVGSPGVGKTQIVKQLADRYGLPFVALSPGTHGEGAFGVVPVPDTSEKTGRRVLDYPGPRWAEDLAEGGGVILDEVLSTERGDQKPLLGMIQEREVGFERLHNRVRVLGLGNPIAESAGGCELGAPVANRMGWLDWDPPTEEEWADWLVTHGGTNGEEVEEQQDARAEEARVLSEWSRAYARAAGLVATFHRRYPGHLLKVPKPNDPALHGAFGTHRSWEYATRALASSSIHGLDADETERLVAAFVGPGARDEFFHFVAEQDLPDPAEVLDCKVDWKYDPLKLDRSYVMLGACIALLTPATCQDREKRAARLWEIVREINEAGAVDVTEPFSRLLVRLGLTKGPEARKALAQQESLLSRAGVGR